MPTYGECYKNNDICVIYYDYYTPDITKGFALRKLGMLPNDANSGHFPHFVSCRDISSISILCYFNQNKPYFERLRIAVYGIIRYRH